MNSKHVRSLSKVGQFAAGLATLALCSIIPETTFAAGRGGNVQPADATPRGYSLGDLAEATGLFTSSGNDLSYYPETPFQVLFLDFSTVSVTDIPGGILISGMNSFTVAPGTPFYVPLWTADDSPPVVGNFPGDASEAGAYFFGPTQVGARGFEVIVDGESTRIDESYVVGPFTTPPLLDGGGSHVVTLGVFLTPMSPGTHTVTIRGGLFGDAVVSTYGMAFAEDDTYTVSVVPGGRTR